MLYSTFRLLLLSFILIGIVACQPSNNSNEQNSPQTVQGSRYSGIILPPETAIEFGYSSPYWQPSPPQVFDLEDRLNIYLKSQSQESLLEKLPGYHRQYVGLTDQGRLIILVNFFCNSLGIDWHNKPVLVLDGGDCYFQVKYDPEEKILFDLIINGDA